MYSLAPESSLEGPVPGLRVRGKVEIQLENHLTLRNTFQAIGFELSFDNCGQWPAVESKRVENS